MLRVVLYRHASPRHVDLIMPYNAVIACDKMCIRHLADKIPISSHHADNILQKLESTLEDPAARQILLSRIQTYDSGNLGLMLRQSDAYTVDKCTQDQCARVKISRSSLRLIAIQHGLPFLGFGFVDNAVMLLAGDCIDLTLGVTLGISSIAAAGIGNIFADLAGLGLGGVIEDICARMGIHAPHLTQQQLMQKEARFAKALGRCIGVTVGCIIGMTPLFFLSTKNCAKEESVECEKRRQEFKSLK